MSDVNLKCVSLATGASSPDLRMNYEFGLVLGVDEFRQEQLYFLEKDYLHNRALHGYGTVYGLDVTTSRPVDNPHELLITVEPGMGIDQYGRPFVLRDAQCARLGAWLAKQEQQAPGSLARHHGTSSEAHVYVVANYDSCDDALVPLAGQPCASSDSTQAPSRIRDSFDIQIRWDPPPMPAWEAVRRFARLMNQVDLVAGLSLAQSDEAMISALVRGLDQPGPFDLPTDIEVLSSPPQPINQRFRLPQESSREALDRIFTVWVTEVRPRLQPDLGDPAGPAGSAPPDPAILLARLDFVPDPSFDVRNPAILDPLEPVDEGRPFLLHTGLIQELLLLGGAGGEQKPERVFATIHAVNSQRLIARVHTPFVVEFAGNPRSAFVLRSDGQQLTIAGATTANNVFTIDVAPNTPILPGSVIELRFQLRQLRRQGDGPLPAVLDALAFEYVGRASDVLTVYGVAERPTREFVTFTATQNSDGTVLQSWFHLDSGVTLPESITAQRVNAGDTITFTARAVNGGTVDTRWDLRTTQSIADQDLLDFAFDGEQIRVGSDNRTLTQVMEDERFVFLDYDFLRTIHAFYAVDLPQAAPQPGGLTWDDIMGLPTLPFVTLTWEGLSSPPGSQERDLTFELWFHLDRDPEEAVEILAEEQPDVRIFGEVGAIGTPALELLDPAELRWRQTASNVFRLWLTQEGWRKVNAPHYLRFVFPTDRNRVTNTRTGDTRSLKEFIADPATRVKFEGHNGQDTIVAYFRIPDNIGG